MSTLKKIAERSGYSLSTVSIVLRGNAVERHIPPSTQEKVNAVARELGYKPNITARRLRNMGNGKQIVAIFWATDYRANLMTNFIKGVQDYIAEKKADIEMVICPYTAGKVDEVATIDNLKLYSAAIICTTSIEELKHIENTQYTTPIVLYNRASGKYCTVLTDNDAIGREAARVLLSHGCTGMTVITDEDHHSYTEARITSFVRECSRSGVGVNIRTVSENSLSQGIACSNDIRFDVGRKHGIFTMSDVLGFGALKNLRDRRIAVPDRCELISIGTGDMETYLYSEIPMAVIYIPIYQMAYECVHIADMLINKRLSKPISEVLDFTYYPAKSAGGCST